MADDILNNTPEQTPTPEQPTISPVEQRAMEQGWVPQEQWDGDPDLWRPAKEFVDRGELFKKIDEGKREIKQLRQAMEEFGKHHAKVRDIEYQRALATLKAQKRDAVAEGDADAVVEIDDRIDELKEVRRAEAAQPQQPVEAQPDPLFVNWVNRNQWYSNDSDMKAVADNAGRNAAVNGITDKKELLEAVEKAVRRAFPHKFTNPNREKPGVVEGSTNKGGSTNKDTFAMSDAEKRIMRKIVSTGAISEEQYIKEYKATRGA